MKHLQQAWLRRPLWWRVQARTRYALRLIMWTQLARETLEA